MPAGLDVRLVCDNYATHNTPEIRAWLARHPGFRVHFTPTGSSWMNQVERWFGLLTAKLIRRGVRTSVRALENDIKAWIATWNDNPRPFTWTKTADEILASLADYLAKVTGMASPEASKLNHLNFRRSTLGAGIRPTKARSVAGIPLRAKRAALVGGLRRGPACGTRADKAERAADAGPAAPQAPLLI